MKFLSLRVRPCGERTGVSPVRFGAAQMNGLSPLPYLLPADRGPYLLFAFRFHKESSQESSSGSRFQRGGFAGRAD